MKCLEDLSLVDDECLEDLQNDIEALIKSYIDIEKCCIETFKNIKEKLHQYHVRSIVKILESVDTFWGMPICITQSGWEKDMKEFFSFGCKEDIEDCMRELMHMFEKFDNSDARELDIENQRYWMYRDGANGELWLEREDYLLDMIEKQIPFECKETQLELLREFKRIERYFNDR